DVLDMERCVNVILPDHSRLAKGEVLEDIPVLYLLHGMSGNQNSWLKRSAIERMTRYTNLAIVMPSTDMAWYTNTQYGMNYFNAITIELPAKIKEFFPQITSSRDKTFIAGNSMGGYGAFKAAFLCDHYGYAASLSGALSFKGIDQESIASEAYWRGIFGSPKEFEQCDDNLLIAAKKRISTKKPLPKLYAWCGLQDFVYEANTYAIYELEHLGYDVCASYEEGIHEWYDWANQIEHVLKWLPINYIEESIKNR
ncbi:MAG: alpha/beta hydrolase family protein, partial [Longicatena sp.]